MRKYAVILCSVLLVAMVFSPGCITQNTGQPVTPPAPHGVNTPPVTPSAQQFANVNLPVAAPTPQVVYVTVTVPVTAQTMVTVPVPSPSQGETVCRVSEQPAPAISMIGDAYGLASVPDDGIDEIRFTLGLDSCSPALDLTTMQIVFSAPGDFPVTLTYGTRTSAGFFSTKTGTTRVTSLDPGDQVEFAFFVTPVPASTSMTIEVKLPDGTSVPFTTTTPARISATNTLL